MMKIPKLTSTLKVFSRSIYLHTGKPISGLKKDPQEVFSLNGRMHEVTESNVASIKSFLGEKYQLPDDIALQALTHKSFANGMRPHNQPLFSMGSHLLRLYLVKRVIGAKTTNENAINDYNLDVLGLPIGRELSSRMTLGLFARTKDLTSDMFWRSFNRNLSFEASGEMNVSAKLVYSLVGAVNYIHGKKIAEQFIQEKLIESEPSIETIAARIVEKAAQGSAKLKESE